VNTQTYENINLSLDAPQPPPMTEPIPQEITQSQNYTQNFNPNQSFNPAQYSGTQYAHPAGMTPGQQPMTAQQPAQQSAQHQARNVQFPVQQAQRYAEPQTRSEAPAREKGSPREALLAKARAYRESQTREKHPQPEQLSMNMEEAMPQRLTPEPSRSPFESDLEVPSYLRRKRGLGTDQNEGIE
jgi:hypothetical protein